MEKTDTLIPVGTAVLTYNHWTNYVNNEVGSFFREANPEEIQGLKKGDTIWIDQDPIHPKGKVYGFVKTLVTDKVGEAIHFRDGFTTFHDKIHIVDDETALHRLIATDPKMTDIFGDQTRGLN